MQKACGYSDLSDQQRVLVADGSCGAAATCLLDRNCAIAQVLPVNATRFDLESHWLIGDLSRYPYDTLELAHVQSATSVHTYLQFPVDLRALVFEQATIDAESNAHMGPSVGAFEQLQLPRALESLTLNNSSVRGTLQFWRLEHLRRLELRNSRLGDFWLNGVGDSLQHLVLDKCVTRWDTFPLSLSLKGLRTLELGGVRTPISRLEVSTELRYFTCDDCDVPSLMVDNATYAALAALAPALPNATTGYRVNRIQQDVAQCTAARGQVKRLWEATSVCIPDRNRPETDAYDDYPWMYPYTTSIYLGGSFVLVCIILFSVYAIRRGRRAVKTRRTADDDYLASTLRPSQIATLHMLQIDADDIVLCGTKPLASGAYGDVWRGIYAHTTVALKRVKSPSPASVHAFIHEILLLHTLESPYIVRLLGVRWRRLMDIEAIVEYCDLGDLRSFLAASTVENVSWSTKATILESIVYGLVFLHTFAPVIIHRDLKSRNVLLDSRNGTKLSDFGTSRILDDQKTLTNGIGTFQWMAPEVILGTEYTVAADIYSFGVILSEMSTHKVPYSDALNASSGRALSQQAILSKVTSGALRPTFAAAAPSWLLEVGNRCLSLDPTQRPTTLELTVLVRDFVIAAAELDVNE
ncbi:TKL protein kinase [Saprolegnia diclina VS20]|uniref:TKL protein kinase n=1 Tax=Saprolegnia diclina (strain VS20) TaxID=1156394 RepID=T0Q152_SAPDV|nr:TKL protein kinase [Saprolegnia diclina VS20]EQC28291.1 TKL protein kinase [Saprolegnia diclina VS20]|eukprot:XP_008618295.1 TKL protein kinase [Saprolegnia diclina VS20]